jgi:hypothetical protein
MRATFCAFAFGLSFFLPADLCAQQFRSEHLNVSNLNPPPPPFPDALRVLGPLDTPQYAPMTHSELRRMQQWADRMETGYRDAVDRVYRKQEEVRDYYLATTIPTIPERGDRTRVPGPFTEHELRYYGQYILPPRPSVLESMSPGEQHELRTPGTRFPLNGRR